jgi:hypothetical protein
MTPTPITLQAGTRDNPGPWRSATFAEVIAAEDADCKRLGVPTGAERREAERQAQEVW